MCKYSFRKSVMNTFRKVVKVCFQSHLNMRKSYLTCDLLLHCSFLKLLKNVYTGKYPRKIENLSLPVIFY